MGPILFLVYINDIICISDKIHITLYADDTNILITGNDITNLITELNTILKELNEYFEANRLTVNTDKTKYMIFNTPHNRRKDNDNFKNNDITVKVTSEFFFQTHVLVFRPVRLSFGVCILIFLISGFSPSSSFSSFLI